MSIPEAEVLHLLREMAETLNNIERHLSRLNEKTPWVTVDPSLPTPVLPDVGRHVEGLGFICAVEKAAQGRIYGKILDAVRPKRHTKGQHEDPPEMQP